MFSFIFGIDQNVIDENHYELIKLCHEYGVHEVHEVGWALVRPKDMTKNS
jgi:hypothetical protein